LKRPRLVFLILKKAMISDEYQSGTCQEQQKKEKTSGDLYAM
jgi:hypothetical protein